MTAKNKNKVVRSIYLNDRLDEFLVAKAKKEQRSVSNCLGMILGNYIQGLTEEELEGYCDTNNKD